MHAEVVTLPIMFIEGCMLLWLLPPGEFRLGAEGLTIYWLACRDELHEPRPCPRTWGGTPYRIRYLNPWDVMKCCFLS